MQVQLTHREAKSLFGSLVDEELPALEALRLKSHLEDCDECRAGWQRYERVVKGARDLERQRAPQHLASSILRRVRRRRFGARALMMNHAQYRVPVEMIIPLLMAVAIAAMLIFAQH